MMTRLRMPLTVLPVAAVLLATLAGGPVRASSDDAWAEFGTRVTRACVAASGIRNAVPSTIVGFDDRVGMVALLIGDRTRGSNGAKLCLYDKRAGTAHVDDAELWSAPRQKR